jgi:cell division protein FtsB
MSPRRTSPDGRFRRVAPSERRGLPHGRWIAAFAVSLVLGLLAVFGSGGWLVAHREAVAVRQLDAELAAVEAERRDVEERISALLEPGGFELERIAREEYRMRAEGEEVIHLVQPETPPDADGSGRLP